MTNNAQEIIERLRQDSAVQKILTKLVLPGGYAVVDPITNNESPVEVGTSVAEIYIGRIAELPYLWEIARDETSTELAKRRQILCKKINDVALAIEEDREAKWLYIDDPRNLLGPDGKVTGQCPRFFDGQGAFTRGDRLSLGEFLHEVAGFINARHTLVGDLGLTTERRISCETYCILEVNKLLKPFFNFNSERQDEAKFRNPNSATTTIVEVLLNRSIPPNAVTKALAVRGQSRKYDK